MPSHRHRLREFEALRAVVTTGTTVGAARMLGISQSAVSRALTQLEERADRPLFIRKSARIEPTSEALRLNEKLDPLFETLAEVEGANWVAPDNQPLRVVVPPTLAHHFIIAKVASFLKQNPGKQLHLDIQSSDALLSGILDLRYDLGVTSSISQRTGIIVEPWRRSQVVCVMPIGHPLSDLDIITPRDLEGIDLVAFLRRLGTRALTEQIFARYGIQPRQVAETATNMAAIDLVREGMGVTLVNPFPILSSTMEGIVVRPFDAAIHYHTSFVLPSGRTPNHLARQFIAFMKENTPEDAYSEPI